MSIMPFLKNFIGAGGTQAAESLTAAIVRAAPELATKAELTTMDDKLTEAGLLITKLQNDLNREQKEFDRVNSQYKEMMAAAEILQKQIDDTATSDDKRASVKKSLGGLIAKIEGIVPQLDREREDVTSTQSLLKEAEAAYQEKARELLDARGNLDRARHDMERAAIEEERAAQRAEAAKVVAGLKTGPSSGLNVALESMQRTAQQARDRASANNMKAQALTTPKDASEDENVKAALAQVKGETSEKSLSERLAALKR